ncbi:MAG: hypothetical protein Q9N26_03090 [Aquificota bacterium]|nr:hypothetical protein [Aquificota bacterium]
MRFFISSNIKSNPPLYVAVVLFLVSALVYWVIAWFVYSSKYGLNYERMFTYFFTDPLYPERIPLSQVLEDVHINFFLVTVFLIVLASVFIHKCVRDSIKYTLILSSFVSVLLDLGSSFLIYFLSPLFIYLKIASFIAFQVSTGIMILLSIKLYLTREKEEPPERSILYTLVFMFTSTVFFFVLINFFLFATKLGVTPQQVAKYYLGDPASFIRPKTFEGLLDVIAPHTVAMVVYLFALVHFSFFTNLKRKVFWSCVCMVSAILDNLSGLMIRFLSDHFAYLKIISFLLLQVSMLYLSIVVVVSILRHRAKAIVLL